MLNAKKMKNGVEVQGEDFDDLLVEVTKEQFAKLRKNNDFVAACLYSGAVALYPGEMGRYNDCRVVLQSGADRMELELSSLEAAINAPDQIVFTVPISASMSTVS